MTKPRWAKTRAKKLRDFNRQPRRWVIGTDFASTAKAINHHLDAALYAYQALPLATRMTITPITRPAPRRRTWRHRS